MSSLLVTCSRLIRQLWHRAGTVNRFYLIVNRLGIASAIPATKGNAMSNIKLIASHYGSDVRCDCEAYGSGCCLDRSEHSLCDVPTGYLAGCKPANYPVPAPLWVSDTATGWSCLRCDCPMCADNYINQLWDDYYISQ